MSAFGELGGVVVLRIAGFRMASEKALQAALSLLLPLLSIHFDDSPVLAPRLAPEVGAINELYSANDLKATKSTSKSHHVVRRLTSVVVLARAETDRPSAQTMAVIFSQSSIINLMLNWLRIILESHCGSCQDDS